jgi:hypothetical protein
MSVGLPTIVQIEYDAEIKAAYQSMGMLRPHVRVKTAVIGGTCEFRRAGRGMATPRLPQMDVTPMNTAYAKVTATLTDWSAAEYTDRLDQVLTNVDERKVIVQNIAGAITRRQDQMILDALDAANGSATIAAAATGLTFDKIRRAKSLMDSRSVPKGRRKLVCSARGEEDLIGEARFTSQDYVKGMVIEDGRITRVLGFDVITIDDRDEGGLPLVSTTRTGYAYDADAIGLAVGADLPLEVNYIPEKTSWLSNQLLKAGAVAIDALGVIEIATVEA